MSDRIETQHDTLACPTFRYKDFALIPDVARIITNICIGELIVGNDSNLLIVFYVQIMPDDF
ncbi:hypothetical protein BZL33_16880, partial [Escherichia coli]